MLRCTLALLLTLALCLPCLSAAAEDNSALDAGFENAFRRNKTIGAAVVIAKDGQIVYQYQYGVMSKKTKEPVTAETYFKIASVTKMISGIYMMQLVEQGVLDLDTDISKYLGYTVRNPYYKKIPVTLRNLMTHTSSLSTKGGFSKLSSTLSSMISTKGKNSNWYREKPGSVYRYSNFGAGIMGSIIESVMKQNLNDAIRAGVFAPLSIDASYAARYLEHPENIPTIYSEKKTTYMTAQASIDEKWDEEPDPDMHFRLTVGALWIKPTDLCRLGMMLCDGGTVDGVTLLQPETVALMMSEQRGQGNITAKTPYGLCVHHETTLVPGRTIYGHQGISHGYLCNVYYDPETRFVFVLCTNGSTNSLNNHVTNLSRRTFALAWEAYSGLE